MNRGKEWACGCQRGRNHGTHHMYGTPTYVSWKSMLGRCENPNAPSFVDYGGRGIVVCDRWRDDFPAFLADMGPRPSQRHSIDRIDGAKGYAPDNCRWATSTEQNRNKRSNKLVEIDGITLPLVEWCERYGADYHRAHGRIQRGMDPVKAMTDPPMTRREIGLAAARWG